MAGRQQQTSASGMFSPAYHYSSAQNFYAENYQQYLAKVPNGYRCHAATGVPFPSDA